MMRWIYILLLSVVSTAAHGNSYHHCTSPLINAESGTALPRPALSFRLSFGDDRYPQPFVAQGTAFDGLRETPLLWRGTWVWTPDTGLHMIGPSVADAADTSEAPEWLGRSIVDEVDLVLIKLDRPDHPPITVRCLPAEGA